MLSLTLADAAGLAWAQAQVKAHHYLRKPVDPRSRPLAYLIRLRGDPLGCLIFGRPEATRCYTGGLTYGSQADVAAGRATYDRWEVLNLARVWLDPTLQAGGRLCTPQTVPGFVDRRGTWHPAAASWAVRTALERIGLDYLLAHPPCFPDEPWLIRVVLSYCDTRRHRGTLYRAAGWELVRRNADGIETYASPPLPPLPPPAQDAVRSASLACPRARRLRRRRTIHQPTLF